MPIEALYLSKELFKTFTFIRIGFVIIPDDLIESFKKGMERNYYSSYYMPNLVSQAVLEATLNNNTIDVMGKAVSDAIKQRIKKYTKFTEDWDPSIIKAYPMKSGVYGIIKLNDKIDINTYINNLKKHNIYVKSTLQSYYHKEDFDNSVRISLARIQSSHLDHVVDKLYETAVNLYQK